MVKDAPDSGQCSRLDPSAWREGLSSLKAAGRTGTHEGKKVHPWSHCKPRPGRSSRRVAVCTDTRKQDPRGSEQQIHVELLQSGGPAEAFGGTHEKMAGLTSCWVQGKATQCGAVPMRHATVTYMLQTDACRGRVLARVTWDVSAWHETSVCPIPKATSDQTTLAGTWCSMQTHPQAESK